MRNFVFGFLVAIIVLVAGGYYVVSNGYVPARADVPPSALEKRFAIRSLNKSVNRDAAGLFSPLKPTDADLLAGIKMYGANCAVCHGAADGKPSLLAQGFAIESPMLGSKDGGVEDDPENITYTKVTHGIRFTAMPAFSKTLNDEQRWQIAAFVKRMDALPPGPAAAWKAMTSAAAGNVAAGGVAPASENSPVPKASDVQRSTPSPGPT